MTRLQYQKPIAAAPKLSAVVDQPTKEQLKQLEADLWSAADNLRANSDLKSSEYATPVLGLIFLKFADDNYRRHEANIIAEYQKLKGTRRERKLSVWLAN
jgi:type I restriction enzyme M protein